MSDRPDLFLVPSKEEEPTVDLAPRAPFCMHPQVTLDVDLHRVTCRQCDREVDAFQILLKYAQNWEREQRRHRMAHDRAEQAKTRMEELLRLERNARARLKRLDPEAARKAPAVPWGHAATDF